MKMSRAVTAKRSANQVMLGFILRRCAAEIGHLPTAEEFAIWANNRQDNGHRYCLFGKPISPHAAGVMMRYPGRLVTVRLEAMHKKLG